MVRGDKKRGFTIAEIMIAVTIITILVAIGLNGYSQNIRRARDTKRQAELELIRGALEMYRADNLLLGYPGNAAALIASLVPAYISQIPVDPLTGDPYYYERYIPSATTYQLCAHLEVPVSSCPVAVDSCCDESLCGTFGTCNYRVTQP